MRMCQTGAKRAFDRAGSGGSMPQILERIKAGPKLKLRLG